MHWQSTWTSRPSSPRTHTKHGARPVREGTALCQGIILCGVCGGRVGTRYGRRDRKVTYKCQAETHGRAPPDAVDSPRPPSTTPSPPCSCRPITPQQIDLALAAADEVADRHARSHRAAELAVAAGPLRGRPRRTGLQQVEPENRLVARTLEARWEAKLAALDRGRGGAGHRTGSQASLPDHDSLQALAADLPRLWHAPTTSHATASGCCAP